jgi:hypothetical protein
VRAVREALAAAREPRAERARLLQAERRELVVVAGERGLRVSNEEDLAHGVAAAAAGGAQPAGAASHRRVTW